MGHLNVRSLVLSCAFMLGSVYNGHVYLVQAEDEAAPSTCVIVFTATSTTDVFNGACRPITNFPCKDKKVADPDGCERFYHCVDRKVWNCPCSAGTGFDHHSSQTCIDKFYANCSCPTTVTTTTVTATTVTTTREATTTTMEMTEMSTKEPDPTEETNTGLSKGAVIGVAVGAVIVLLLIALVIVMLVVRRKREHRRMKYANDNRGMPPIGYETRLPDTAIYSTIDEDMVAGTESIYDNSKKAPSTMSAPLYPLPPLPITQLDDGSPPDAGSLQGSRHNPANNITT